MEREIGEIGERGKMIEKREGWRRRDLDLKSGEGMEKGEKEYENTEEAPVA